MDTLISKCDGENVVLQVDFSENATIASPNETQSSHWCHGQATHSQCMFESRKMKMKVLSLYQMI